MKKIQNMLKIKPDLEKLNLSFLQIESLEDIAYELYHFENLKEIDLSCNRLRKLPADLSILKMVQRLDLTNNLFENLNAVLSSLATMPSLIELNLTFDPAKLSQSLGHYLPNLEVVNGEVIKAGGAPQMTNPVIRVNDGKFEIDLAKSSKGLPPHAFILYEDELLNLRHFHQNVYTIIQDGNNNPKTQTKGFLESVKALEEGVKAGYKFNDELTEKAKEELYKTNGQTYEVKRDFIFNIIKNYLVFLKDRYPKVSSATENLFKLTAFLLNNLEKKAPFLQDDIFKLEIPELEEKEINEILPESRRVEEMDTEKVLLKLKLSEQERELEELRRENDEMFRFLINSSKKDVVEYAKKVNKNTYAGPQESRKLGDTAARAGSLLTLKSYSLRQMNDLIADIMESKRAYDEKSAKTRARPETLESFLFIYFQQKYGLKDLILVEVSSVIEKIKSFAGKSVEIETFKRILKNEVDEKFYWMLQNIKSDFKVKLQQYYLEKVKKSAPLNEAAGFAGSKVNGFLEKEEADFVLAASYKATELKGLNKLFKVFFDENDSKVNGKNMLSFSSFLEFVFNHELEKHVEYLKYISDYFNRVDEDKNGVITKKQFLEFLDVFAARKAQISIEGLVSQADPASNNRVTFSKIIEVCSSNFVDREKQQNLVQFLNKI